jgi:GntR family transcriptional regulator/MocR family aminotransferase
MSNPQANSAADRPSALGIDLHVDLTGPRRRAGLTNALREAVRSGRLVPGTRLPPTRSLAADLGIARSTVAEAYSNMVAEGWLTARQGSGTRVAKRIEPRKTARTAPRETGLARPDVRPAAGRAGPRGVPARAVAHRGPPRSADGRIRPSASVTPC